MKTYKVYLRIRHRLDIIFVQAANVHRVELEVSNRFPKAGVSKIVEMRSL